MLSQPFRQLLRVPPRHLPWTQSRQLSKKRSVSFTRTVLYPVDKNEKDTITTFCQEKIFKELRNVEGMDHYDVSLCTTHGWLVATMRFKSSDSLEKFRKSFATNFAAEAKKQTWYDTNRAPQQIISESLSMWPPISSVLPRSR